MEKRNVYIIMPMFNEQEHVVEVIKNIQEETLSWKKFNLERIYIVDDHSTDHSYDLITDVYFSLDILHGTVGIGKAPFNLGKTHLLRSFFWYMHYNAEPSNDDIVVLMDADRQHFADDIIKLIRKVNNENIVIGKRDMRSYPLIKKIGNKFLASLARFLTSYRITDTETGFRAMKWSTMKDIFPRLESKRYGGEIEQIIIADKLGYIINEVPIKSNYRKGKGSCVSDGIKNAIVAVKTFTRQYKSI